MWRETGQLGEGFINNLFSLYRFFIILKGACCVRNLFKKVMAELSDALFNYLKEISLNSTRVTYARKLSGRRQET